MTIADQIQTEQSATRKNPGNKKVEFNSNFFNRWQKHGEDRLYVKFGQGYIDVEEKKACNPEPEEDAQFIEVEEQEDGSLKVFIDDEITDKERQEIAEVF